MIIGIDLGTTNSVAAYMSESGPELIPNAVGTFLTPSIVGIEESGELLVGHTAQEYQVLHPQRCAALFKRHMGSDTTVQLGRRKFTPEELSSLVLASLKADAGQHLGCEVTRAVITVPAYFNDNQRKATIQAGQLAGLRVERIINEPTAAAIAYGLHEAEEEKIVAVFDLGGGTFDVSIVDLFEGAVEVRASAGESFLGGEDFTRALAARVLEQRGMYFERAELEAPLQVSRLIDLCERAKRQLARETSVSVAMPNKQGEITGDDSVEVTREKFIGWTEHLLSRLEMPVRRSLGDARLTFADVTEVILVGGATRMHAVTDRVTKLFQRAPLCRMNPDEVVALGAAVQAGLIERHAAVRDLVVTDVCPFTLGVEVSKQLGTEYRSGYFSPIINRNTTIPVSRVERLSTLQANQRLITLKIYQGESRRVSENLLLGELEVSGIPLGPSGQAVDVRFTYDLNGVLEVEAEIVATGKKLTEVITQHVHGLSQAEIAAAVASMQALKTHPREETKYRYLLKRAERLYQELDLLQRSELSRLIDGFEAALDLQEPEVIESHAEVLREFVEQFDSPSSNEDTWGNEED